MNAIPRLLFITLLFTGTSATPLFAAALTLAQKLPQIKSGHWEIRAQVDELPGFEQISTACVDARTRDALIRQSGECSKITLVDYTSHSWEFDSTCKLDGSTAISRSAFSGDPQTLLKGEANSTFTPPWRGLSQAHGKVTARWVGATCPADQKPGSVKVRRFAADFGKINVDELLKNLPVPR